MQEKMQAEERERARQRHNAARAAGRSGAAARSAQTAPPETVRGETVHGKTANEETVQSAAAPPWLRTPQLPASASDADGASGNPMDSEDPRDDAGDESGESQ